MSNWVSLEPVDFLTEIDSFNKNEWKYEKLIYRGNNATVYKIRHIKQHTFGVLKKYSKIYLNSQNIDKIKKIFEVEIECIKILYGSKYTPPAWYYYETTAEMGIIMKYMANNTLKQYMHSFFCNDCIMSSAVYPLLKALKNIHTSDIIHRDIKPENIFIHKNNIYIGDYGYSYILKNNAKAHGIVGTLQYMAPELLKAYLDNDENIEYNKEIDIWAIGIIVYEMVFHEKPFGWNKYKENGTDSRFFIMNCISKELDFPYTIPDDEADFIRKCLQKNPSNRPTITELLEHEWVLNYLKNKDDINEKCRQQSFLLIQTMMKKQIHLVSRRFQTKSVKTRTPFWKMICTIS